MANNKTIMLRCDDCPYVVEESEQLKDLLGDDYQPEYCYYDKVGGKFVCRGVCSDAAVDKSEVPLQNRRKGERQTGPAYRRKMKKRKLRARVKLYDYGYRGSLGWYDNHHIKLPKNSKRQKFYKKYANKRVRRYDGEIPKGGAYKRFFEYWWTID